MPANSKQIIYFDRVAELGSLSAAAEDLRISQPAVGKQIELLEQSLGVQLLRRHSRGITLTPTGRLVQKRGKEILAKFRELEDDVARSWRSTSRAIELGVTPMLGKVFVTELLERVYERFPNLRVNVEKGYSDELVSRLRRDELDLAFSHDIGSSGEFDLKPLFADSLFLIGPTEMLGGSETPIRFDDLSAYPLNMERRDHPVRRAVDVTAKKRHIELRVALETDDESLRTPMLVSLGHCTISPFGLYADEIENGNLAARTLSGPSMDRNTYVVLRKGIRARSTEHAIVDIAKDLAETFIREGRFRWRSLGNSKTGASRPVAVKISGQRWTEGRPTP